MHAALTPITQDIYSQLMHQDFCYMLKLLLECSLYEIYLKARLLRFLLNIPIH